jgi:hypothetical protein
MQPRLKRLFSTVLPAVKKTVSASAALSTPLTARFPAASQGTHNKSPRALFSTYPQRKQTLGEVVDEAATGLLLGVVGLGLFGYGTATFEKNKEMKIFNEALNKLGLNENEKTVIERILYLHNFPNHSVFQVSEKGGDLCMLNIRDKINNIYKKSTDHSFTTYYSDDEQKELQHLCSLLFEIHTDVPMASDTFKKCMKKLSELVNEKYKLYEQREEEESATVEVETVRFKKP